MKTLRTPDCATLRCFAGSRSSKWFRHQLLGQRSRIRLGCLRASQTKSQKSVLVWGNVLRSSRRFQGNSPVQEFEEVSHVACSQRGIPAASNGPNESLEATTFRCMLALSVHLTMALKGVPRKMRSVSTIQLLRRSSHAVTMPFGESGALRLCLLYRPERLPRI